MSTRYHLNGKKSVIRERYENPKKIDNTPKIANYFMGWNPFPEGCIKRFASHTISKFKSDSNPR